MKPPIYIFEYFFNYLYQKISKVKCIFIFKYLNKHKQEKFIIMIDSLVYKIISIKIF